MTEKEFNQLLECLELDEEQLELISGGSIFRESMSRQELFDLLKITQQQQDELNKKTDMKRP